MEINKWMSIQLIKNYLRRRFIQFRSENNENERRSSYSKQTDRYQTYSIQLILPFDPLVSSSHHRSKTFFLPSMTILFTSLTSPLNAKQIFKPIVVMTRYQKIKYNSLHLWSRDRDWRDIHSVLCIRWSTKSIDKYKPLIDDHNIVQCDHRRLRGE